MNHQDAIAEHYGLFKLDWVREPEILEAQAKQHGLSDRLTLETSAWCAELHAQLEGLARRAGLELLLMGGNATALRMDVSAQRGSRDNDYLTTATEQDVEALISDLRRRFAPLPEPLFTYRRLEPEDALPLPLVSYVVQAPALSAYNQDRGTIGVKLEFHLSKPSEMPESEEVEGQFLAVGQPVRARMPRVPHQLALKAMTLLAPPIGVGAAREDAIPRQLYDLDDLAQRIAEQRDWGALMRYAEARYATECEQHQVMPAPDGPWKEIIARLEQWKACADSESEYWQSVNAFQSGQLARGRKRTPEEWRARVQRLKLLARCLSDTSDGFKVWKRSLRIETRLRPAEGQELRAQRAALGRVVGIPGRKSLHGPVRPTGTSSVKRLTSALL